MPARGSIRAEPNPIRVISGPRLGATTLTWASQGPLAVEVRVGAPDGRLFSRSGPEGRATTGRWVTDGTVFYLQDVSSGLPLTADNTLGTVTVGLSAEPHAVPDADPLGQWGYDAVDKFHYGDDTTYEKGIAFLDGHGLIEDWGCGFAHAKQFVKKSAYLGIDGSQSGFADRIADLTGYTSDTDCIFMRHVLEHNYHWPKILKNAVASFRARMALVLFTPLAEVTGPIAVSETITSSPVPDIAFRREDLVEFFRHCRWTEESLVTDTQYGREHVFYVEK